VFSSSSSSSGGGEDDKKKQVTATTTREELLEEAAALTKSLYRICFRSATKVIRWGNAFDEKEFQRREEEFGSPTSSGNFSMAPPPDREDELRSRAAYYQSYAREYFTQESDCLDNDPWEETDISRYLYYLRKGDKDRKWLLGDMMFPDPYKNAMDQERIKKFGETANRYIGVDDDEEEEEEEEQDETSTDNAFDETEDENPEWFKKKYPHLQ
jgi:hypothetical protein